MKLYFLRHGGPATVNSTSIKTDAERPLTREGIEILKLESKGLERLNVSPDIIWHSPLVRARETAEVVARELGLKNRLVETVHLQMGAGIPNLQELLSGKNNLESAMFVGHEPDFSSMVGSLMARSGAVVEMKKGGIALVETDVPLRLGGGVLMWLLTPKVIVKLVSGHS